MVAPGGFASRRLVAALISLIGVMAGIALLLGVPHAWRTDANVGVPAMEFRANGTGVTCDAAFTKCTVPSSGVFNVEVLVAAFPGDPDGAGPRMVGYTSIQTDIDWTGSALTYLPTLNSLEVPWPDRSNFVTSRNPPEGPIETRVGHGDISGLPDGFASTFKGVVVRLQFECSANNSSGPVRLLPYSSDNPLGSALTDDVTYIFETADSIFIHCGAAVATNTPGPASATMTPTRTPPFGPGCLLIGDVRGYGDVNAIDAWLILAHPAGLIGTLRCPAQADVNGDGHANAIDASLVLQYAVGLLNQLPP